MIGKDDFKNAANNIVREPSVELYLGENEVKWVICSVSKNSKNFNGKPFGNAVPQELKVVVQGEVNLPKDTEVNVQYIFGGIESDFVYPTFYVQECIYDAESRQTTVTAKDRLFHLIEEKYDAKTDGTLTAGDFFKRYCESFGFDYEIREGALTSLAMPQNPNFSEDDSALTVLAKLAEMMCCNAFIRDKNTLCLAPVKTDADAVLSIEHGVSKFSKDAAGNPINRVVLSRGDLGDNEYLPKTDPANITEYTIVNNPFIDNNDSIDSRGNYVNALYSYINGQTYTGYSLTFNGNPCLECGDVIAVKEDTKNGAVYHKVIFYGDTLTFDNGMSSSVTIDYTPSTVSYSSKKGSIGKAIREANIKVDKVEATILMEVSDIDADINYVKGLIQKNSDRIAINDTNLESIKGQYAYMEHTVRGFEANIGEIKEELEKDVTTLRNTKVNVDIDGITVGEAGIDVETNINAEGININNVGGGKVARFNIGGATISNVATQTMNVAGTLFNLVNIDGTLWGAAYWIGEDDLWD